MSTRRRSSRAGARLACACFAWGLATTLAPGARADDDALAQYRDRFRLGMEIYKAGGMAEAIRVWNAIYEEIGPKRGYRLSYNLARAYDVNGEATRAAERYRSFLEEARSRVYVGEAVDPLVEHEAHEAEARLDALDQSHGRIEVVAGAAATLAKIDDTDPRLGAFTAYVAAGKHVVTFGPGHANARTLEVSVDNGARVVAQDPAPPRPDEGSPPRVDPLFLTRRVLKSPFSPVVLYVGGVATVASVLAPALAYSHANSVYATATSASSSVAARESAYGSYGGSVTLAYAMIAVPITLGVVTGGLTAWFFAGTKEREVPVSLGASPLPGGGAASLVGRF